jgi:fused signal recognition particle receptor
MFESLKNKLSALRGKATEPLPAAEAAVGDSGRKIDERDVDELLWELELGLLESDVALPVIEQIKADVRTNLVGKRIDRKYTLDQVVEAALRSAIEGVLKKSEFDFDGFVRGHERPVIIMFVGINGTGKTTVIAKLSNRLQKMGLTTVLSASDTFRAGAIEQLTVHSERLGTKIVKHQSGGDPAAVAFDAVDHAKAKRRDVVLVDTAGRMQTNANLMDEMKKIRRVVSPHLIVFVGDSLAGNDAIEQAIAFDKAVGIDAVILTKIDTDAKGGAALSIANAIGKPIAFLSTGQGYEDIIKFDSRWMVDRLFSD